MRLDTLYWLVAVGHLLGQVSGLYVIAHSWSAEGTSWMLGE